VSGFGWRSAFSAAVSRAFSLTALAADVPARPSRKLYEEPAPKTSWNITLETNEVNILLEKPSVTTSPGTKGLFSITADYDFGDVPFVSNLRPFEIFAPRKPPVRMTF
jgi:hypothetical protein